MKIGIVPGRLLTASSLRARDYLGVTERQVECQRAAVSRTRKRLETQEHALKEDEEALRRGALPGVEIIDG